MYYLILIIFKIDTQNYNNINHGRIFGKGYPMNLRVVNSPNFGKAFRERHKSTLNKWKLHNNLPRLDTSPLDNKDSNIITNNETVKFNKPQLYSSDEIEILWNPELAVTTKRLLKSIDRSKAKEDSKVLVQKRNKNWVYSSNGSRNNINKK